MTRTIVSPFSGPPHTDLCKDTQGNSQFVVTARALTPMRGKAADSSAGLIALASTLVGLDTLSNMEPLPGEAAWLAVIVCGLICHPVLRAFTRWLFKKEQQIKISKELFSVKGFRCWKHYDRKLPHKLSLILHDKAQKENEDHQLEIRKAQARGQIISRTRYFGESYHLIYEYVGQRIDLMAIYDRKEALKIASRLKACDEVMDQKAKMGEGVALKPQEQWDNQPGDL